MDKQRKIVFFHSVMFMFISPAYSLYHGLRSNFGRDAKRWLLIIFITFYGSIITLSDFNDGFRHQQNVYDHYTNMSFSQFLHESWYILTFQIFEGTVEDIYIHILSYFVGSVLYLPGMFFVFVSFIYAYFFIGSLFLLLEGQKKNKSWLFYGFLILFILLKNLEGINTVRTWTGLWVLFYGSLGYYKTKKIKYLLLMFLPPFIHVGYFLMAIPAWTVLIAGYRPKLYSLIFAISFFVNLPNPDRLFNQLEETSVGAEKVQQYSVDKESSLGEIAVEQKNSSSTWYIKAEELGIQKIACNILAFAFIIFFIYPNQMDALETRLFSTGILTMAFSNVTWILFAVSARTGLIAMVFIIGAFILMWRRNYFDKAYFLKKKILMGILKICLLLCVPFMVLRVAMLIIYISVYMLIFPFIPWFTDDVNYSIRELLGLFV